MYAELLLAALLVDGLSFTAVFVPKNAFVFVGVEKIMLLFVLFAHLLFCPWS